MDFWLNIILIAVIPPLGIFLSTLNMPIGTKIPLWIFCASSLILGVYRVTKEKKAKEKEAKAKEFYRQLLEKQQLVLVRGRPQEYVDGLGENPLLKDSFNQGQKYEKQLKYNQAIKEYKNCLSHPNATVENKVAANILIGNCYYYLFELKGAEDHFQQALALSKKIKDKTERLKAEATSLNNLALLYHAQGKYDQAEPLYKRALRIKEKTLGPEHPSVATSLNNLALLYKAQGKYEQAEPLYKRALKIDEKALGKDHPYVARDLNNLAELYRKQGKYEQVEPLYKRALKIWEKALGLEHSDIATSLNNLALLYDDQGKIR